MFKTNPLVSFRHHEDGPILCGVIRVTQTGRLFALQLATEVVRYYSRG